MARVRYLSWEQGILILCKYKIGLLFNLMPTARDIEIRKDWGLGGLGRLRGLGHNVYFNQP